MKKQLKEKKDSAESNLPGLKPAMQPAATTEHASQRREDSPVASAYSDSDALLDVDQLHSRDFTDDDMRWQSGRESGFFWAQHRASAIELYRLARDRSLRLDRFFDIFTPPYTDAERFFFVIRPDQDGDRAAAKYFWWEQMAEFESKLPPAAFVQGFHEGAILLWKRVKDRV